MGPYENGRVQHPLDSRNLMLNSMLWLSYARYEIGLTISFQMFDTARHLLSVRF